MQGAGLTAGGLKCLSSFEFIPHRPDLAGSPLRSDKQWGVQNHTFSSALQKVRKSRPRIPLSASDPTLWRLHHLNFITLFKVFFLEQPWHVFCSRDCCNP